MIVGKQKNSYTTETYINKVMKIHNNKYDYSNTVYVNFRTPIIITCAIHGNFEQDPKSHLNGSGCSKCYFDSKRMSTEEFINKVKIIHNNKYLYDKTNYETAQKKIIVTCPEHGDFLVKASHHLNSKQGCKQCFFSSRRSDLVDIIKKANEVHNGKYDYSKTKYVTSHEKTTITCPEHGDFEISITNHLSGQGCPACGFIKSGLSRRSNTEEFIARAKEVHGNKYDYSKVDYKRDKEKVIISCNIHGDFEQRPRNHLIGSGCPECAYIKFGLNKRNNTKDFIEKAIAIHGDKYDYSKVDYVTDRIPVTIICKKHGEFTKTPNKHLSGQGCKLCSQENSITGPKLTLQDFITKASVVHNNIYDYSKAIYINSKTKLIIICSIHGEFKQSPSTHLAGSKCPRCKASKGELVISDILKRANIDFQTEFKPPKSTTRHRYDFYLPSCNLLIEFHGIQHYESIPFFGGEESLKETKFRDAYKKAFAKLAGYNYLEFNYKQLKHLTEEAFEKLVLRLVYKHLNHS